MKRKSNVARKKCGLMSRLLPGITTRFVIEGTDKESAPSGHRNQAKLCCY